MVMQYRKYYNKMDPRVDSMAFSSMEMTFQMSKTQLFRVSYVPEDGLSMYVIRLLDSKRRIVGCNRKESLDEVNLESRSDILRLYLKWDGRHGESLSDTDLSDLLHDLDGIRRRYNNVVILDGEHRLSEQELIDFSKRKLRLRSTGDTSGWRYYDPDEIVPLRKSVAELDEEFCVAKQRLSVAVSENDYKSVGTLSDRVVKLMRLVLSGQSRLRDLERACRYIDTDL